MLLLDNQSNIDLFCNNNLVTRFWTIDEFMIVKGNGGAIKTTWKSHVKGYGEVWFDEQAITNILVLKNVKRKFRVTYNSNNKRVFAVQNPSRKYVHFNIHK